VQLHSELLMLKSSKIDS